MQNRTEIKEGWRLEEDKEGEGRKEVEKDFF